MKVFAIVCQFCGRWLWGQRRSWLSTTITLCMGWGKVGLLMVVMATRSDDLTSLGLVGFQKKIILILFSEMPAFWNVVP